VEPLAVQPDRCAVIAEVAQGHDGSLGLAHSFIDLATEAGVDAIKFQTHIAAAESTPDEPWRVRFSYEDASRYDYWQRMEFTEAQWRGLREHCDAVGRPYAEIERTNLQSGRLSQEVADGGRTPEALLDDLAALAEAGVQHTILGIPARGVEGWIDVVGDRVIPGARAL